MALEPEELAAILEEIRTGLTGWKFTSARALGRRSWLLEHRRRRLRRGLVVSALPGYARIHLAAQVQGGEARMEFEEGRAFATRLEECLRRRRLSGIAALEGEGLVLFRYSARANEAGARYVLLRLRGRRPTVRICEESGRCLAALDSAAGRDAAADTDAELIRRASASFRAAPAEGPWPDETVEFPFSNAIEASLGEAERRREVETLRGEVLRRIRKERVRLERALGKVALDLEKTARADEERRLGDLLKANFHLLRKGMSSVEVIDYFDATLPKIRVPLDPALSPQENLELHFRRARKRERGKVHLERRRSEIESRLREVEALENRAAQADLEELLRLKGRLPERGKGRERADPETRVRGEALPGRRFLSRDGLEILVGRNARENEELTLRLARGNDLFLHLAGRPAAHVIVRVGDRPGVPSETLLDAATLAVYFGLRFRSPEAAEGARGEVDYTEVKYVRRPRGAPPGTVYLARRRTLRVRIERERLERLLQRR